ncbi:putative Photosynthetic reaction centre cytochrome c subunit [Candidatus Zixiibacteriota bacterium]|nr:putative Photosynthetic reaction centre cytochrome c subunit [candidate division Zixibacteria bacterium]
MIYRNSRSREHMSIYFLLMALFCTLIIYHSDLRAQEAAKPTNLKVLDSTISHDQLISIMSNFSGALGVRCDYCHARSSDPNKRDLDFPSDAKKTKLAAREMMKMVASINGMYISHLPTVDSPRVVVECITCHRGQPRPFQLEDILKQALAAHGMQALDSAYRTLRKEYYGSGSYDFSDHVLASLALDISQVSDTDAIAILKLNREFNPQSATTEWVAGRIFLQAGDTAGAVTEYKKALEIDPNYRRAMHDLQVLSATETK